jgi:transposase
MYSGWRKSSDRAYKRGLNTKVHLAIDKWGKPVRIIVSARQEADCAYAPPLMADLSVKVLIADRGYDVNQGGDTACARGIKVVIPSKRSRKEARTYDTELYKKRHLIENIFRWLKQWRGIATWYAQRSDSFLTALSSPRSLPSCSLKHLKQHCISTLSNTTSGSYAALHQHCVQCRQVRPRWLGKSDLAHPQK